MKKQFENPEVEVERFELEDLITTSGDCYDDGGCPGVCPEK